MQCRAQIILTMTPFTKAIEGGRFVMKRQVGRLVFYMCRRLCDTGCFSIRLNMFFWLCIYCSEETEEIKGASRTLVININTTKI